MANNIAHVFEFSHNSVVYNFKNPFFIHRITNPKFNNNIFYASYAGGMNKTEFNGGWDELTAMTPPSIFSYDTISAHVDSLFDPADAADANHRWLAKAKRTVEVKNNAYFWPPELITLWTAWNTASESPLSTSCCACHSQRTSAGVCPK